ncbi:MAG: hypothetical protein IJ297_04565 [Clostridia bacterium]|nr:hypothetical protein [Clostridia bacterium]
MIVSDAGQAKVFVINIVFGMLCIMLYDVLGVCVNRAERSKKFVVLTDCVYLVGAFVLMLFASVKYNLGAFRYYQVMALLSGMLLYKAIFSHIVKKVAAVLSGVSVYIFKLLFALIRKPVMLLLRALFTVTDAAENRIIFFCHKAKRRADKVKLKNKRKQKNVKKRLEMI